MVGTILLFTIKVTQFNLKFTHVKCSSLSLSQTHAHAQKIKEKRLLHVSAVVVPCADSTIFILYVIK